MNKTIITIIIAFMMLVVPVVAQEMTTTTSYTINDENIQNNINIVVVYGDGCPHCARLHEFLNSIEDTYPTMNVIEYEVYFDRAGRKNAEAIAKAYGKELGGVPEIFINDKMMVGFSNSIGEQLLNEIEKCLVEKCENPLDRIKPKEDLLVIETSSSPNQDPEKKSALSRITIPAIITAAAVDAINPCAFAVLIILLTTILASKNKKRSLFAGLAFSLSIFISYFLMGLGLFSAVKSSGVTHLFYTIVAVLAIIIGLFNLKDYLWYGKWFKMEVPDSWRPKMKTLLKGVTSIPGAFFIGFVISLFLLPCTSGPYIVILGLLAESTTRAAAIPLLLLYNFIFVLPMLIITFAISFGFTTTAKADEWRTRKLRVLHLIAGVLILAIGIVMCTMLVLGYV